MQSNFDIEVNFGNLVDENVNVDTNKVKRNPSRLNSIANFSQGVISYTPKHTHRESDKSQSKSESIMDDSFNRAINENKKEVIDVVLGAFSLV